MPEEVDKSALISYLYKQHSVSQHRDGQGWSICCITEHGFSLDGTLPIHNYPLGNTIYVLYAKRNEYGDYSLYHDAGERIKEDIRIWREQQFPLYPDKNEIMDVGDFSPRVRMLILPLPPSPCEIKSREDQVDAKKIDIIIAKIDSFQSKDSLSISQREKLIDVLKELLMHARKTENTNTEESILSSINNLVLRRER